jgi:hypothetical protein
MDENLEYGFGTAIFVLDHTADKLTAEEAWREFAEPTKENFWRMWPHVRQWADEMWHLLDDERRSMSRPAIDEELDEVGGGG